MNSCLRKSSIFIKDEERKGTSSTTTMYDFHDSTDTLKFFTEKWAINKPFFVFHLILMKLGEVVVNHVYYNFTKFHQNRMKNKKRFINSPFFCSEFQTVSRTVKIVHSAVGPSYQCKKGMEGRGLTLCVYT